MEDSNTGSTQRLAFDSEEMLKDVPQFLKKDVVPRKSEEVNPDDLEPGTSGAISVDNPTNTEMENKEMEFGATPTSANVNNAMTEATLQSLAEMSIEQLKIQQAEIDRKIQEKQKNEKQAVIAQIVQVVGDYDIPVPELVEALGGIKFRRKGTKAKTKYRDPNTGSTWSGRGKAPSWIKDVEDRTAYEI